jgi:hypothetical protein
MGNCQRIELLFKLIPIKSWQYSLLQRHLLRCDKCLKNLVGIEEAKSATISKEKIRAARDFWPEFRRGVKEAKPRRQRQARPAYRRWAFGTVALLAVISAGVFILTLPQKKENLDQSIKLRVNYARIYEQPAQAFVFQTQDPDSTFVWVEKIN